jgi:hypothetical protein
LLASQTCFIALHRPCTTKSSHSCSRHRGQCGTLESCRKLLATPSFMPATLLELSACFRSNRCAVFQGDNNPEGHATTNSQDWIRSSSEWRDPRPLECFLSGRYEPYVVLSSAAAYNYDERFKGYGKNKIQYIQHLRHENFKFAVLPREFLLHFPHPRSSAKFRWLLNPKVHRNVDREYSRYLKELRKINTAPFTPICPTRKRK